MAEFHVDELRQLRRYAALRRRVTPGRSFCNKAYALCIFIGINAALITLSRQSNHTENPIHLFPLYRIRLKRPTFFSSRLHCSAGTFTYEVKGTRIVHADDKTVIVPTDHAVLTMTTCYPFNIPGYFPDRYIVSANLLKSESTIKSK